MKQPNETVSTAWHVKENFSRLIRFDTNRIQKILEIGQYMLLTMVLSAYISDKIDNYMGKYDKNMSTLQLSKSIQKPQ